MFGKKQETEAAGDPNTEKVKVRLFDRYGNVQKANIRVQRKDKFLEDALQKIVKMFGGA